MSVGFGWLGILGDMSEASPEEKVKSVFDVQNASCVCAAMTRVSFGPLLVGEPHSPIRSHDGKAERERKEGEGGAYGPSQGIEIIKVGPDLGAGRRHVVNDPEGRKKSSEEEEVSGSWRGSLAQPMATSPPRKSGSPLKDYL
jgi:hypothetical protein